MFIVELCRWFFLGLYNVFTIIPRSFIIGIICIIDPKKGAVLKYKGKPIIPTIMLGLTLTTYFICIFVSSRWYVQKLKINYLATDILSSTEILEKEEKEVIKQENYIPNGSDEYTNISFMSVDFKELLEKNNETVAWIKVNNTNVNYSVTQHNDNEYYLKHDFYKNYNANGWVYGDYRADFKYFGTNTILYAHNLTNRSMFGSLIWCLKESWYKNEENRYIKLSTPYSNTVWKIFSIYTIKPEVYYLKTYFSSDEEHQTFLDTIKKRSIYKFDNENLTTDDKVLTLSTCSDDGKKRVVIHAKMVKAEYR
ncbi:MAG: class B sortase [Bacilli bacterium]|nr:class B sortase [Bacilli bacterium]